ncbi:MAG: hypothetical protein GWM98_10190, partial [Nitrospinaceae bacterium]|nr:general secretion pathway protein GspK [Nitrospinaceae bacterium]NIR54789.1 general secretion pathway protein GspK [Nitrospinaceae bacterium]NIS85215.1 general secretion pathway protein GspK [Nitrospinaceae bacterium]NIT82025.1 general secretion pathway protein GspK [Nitrospinaceae bacterium]NIU44289.1 general secretion pathway protein GspK [Nitrospinaceae bacterium]
MKRPDQNQEGIALLVVVWVLVLLTALATELSFSMKMEVNTTRNFKEDVESYHLAKAGVQLAMAEILRPARYHSLHPERGWITGLPTPPSSSEEETAAEDESSSEPEFLDVERTDLPLGPGTVTYTIEDENSKIGINTASRDLLVKALTAAGLEVGETRDIIADSILDWIDKDENHRLNGAESEYYQRRNPPYAAKNGPLETLEELLKVRGMTPEIFHGSGEDSLNRYTGLKQFFTVYPVSQVNPNTASQEVLSVLFDETQVEEILRKKEEQ